MKYYLADSLDTVDREYDFANEERNTANRQVADVYGHELFPVAPYDGILISRAKIEGRHSRFSPGQRYRLMRGGIHSFLRVPSEFPTMIDSGSYSHLGEKVPPYGPEDCVRFYSQCGFDAGVSPDCVILDMDCRWDDPRRTPNVILSRAESTYAAALEFLATCRDALMPFEPIGVVQSWSPKSAASYARKLVAAGYAWLGLGGLAHRRTREIYDVLCEVRAAIPEATKMHVFGFSRIDQLEAFSGLGITSIDSASPLLKAVKDDRHNYLSPDGDHYLAVKLPARHQTSVSERISSGAMEACAYAGLEREALQAFRDCACRKTPVDVALQSLKAYHSFAFEGEEFPSHAYTRVLSDRPWEKCGCAVCRSIGPEVILLRGINRNKRRGFHNSYVFHRKVMGMEENKRLQFPAIRFEQSGGNVLFQFVARAHELARFTTVSHLRRDGNGILSGFQRPEVESHISEIHAYLERPDAMLPNAVIIAMRTTPEFTPGDGSGDCGQVGTLTISMSEEVPRALIVDGQQRCAAFRRLKKANFPVPVIAFVAASTDLELQQFLLVNNAKPLPKTLIHELLPALGRAVPQRLGLRQKACAFLERLTHDPESPFNGRVRTMTSRHLPDAGISDAAVIKMIENSMTNGMMFSLGERGQTAMTQLRRFWQAVSNSYPVAWELPPRRSRLTHGAGIVAMGYLMDTIFDALVLEHGLPTVADYESELRLLGDLPWTEGVWRFGPQMFMPWNEVQNTSRHRELLSNHLVREYLYARKKESHT